MPLRFISSPGTKPYYQRPGIRVLFHTTVIRNANHYDTLSLPRTASLAEIKKQFYSLSKTHHPDHNPHDPDATTRFVNISEAYAVLGSQQKKEQYDRDLDRALGSSNAVPRGSHSSTTGSAGGRPASGLSRRRTQFKGPPPSFYRNGGWSTQRAKRHTEGNVSDTAGANSGGFGFAGQQQGFSNDVPHFDREGHLKTHENHDKRRQRRRTPDQDPGEPSSGVLANFIFVGSILSVAIFLPAALLESFLRKGKNDRQGQS